MKTNVRTKTIVGAGALSRKKLIQIPKKEDKTVTKTEVDNMQVKSRVDKKAMDPGAINKPIERMIPTDDKVATIVNEIKISNK